MQTILTDHGLTLAVVRCWCGIEHAVPKCRRDLQRRQFDNGENMIDIHCPEGHTHCPAGERECDRLKRKVKQERESADRMRIKLLNAQEQTRAMDNRRRAEKGAKTKLKKRIAAGVCPCCNRTFQNLARHMKGQHPEFQNNS